MKFIYEICFAWYLLLEPSFSLGLWVKMLEEEYPLSLGSLSSRAQVIQTGTHFVKLLPYIEMATGLFGEEYGSR